MVFRAYGNEEVTISASNRIPLSEFAVSEDERISSELAGKIYSINLQGKGIENLGNYNLSGHSVTYLNSMGVNEETGGTMPVLVNGSKQMTNARYPNEGYMQVGTVLQAGDIIRDWMEDKADTSTYVPEEDRNNPPIPMQFKADVTADRIARWANASDAWVHGYWYYDWSDQTTPVKEIDVENSVITTKYPSAYGVRKGQRFYIYNLLEELDSPGEWYYDRETDELFVYPSDTSADSVINITYPIDEIISVENAANIVFDGISILNSGGKGISIHNSSNVTVQNCTVSQTADEGINVNGGKNVSVLNNKISSTGRKGIYVSGGDFQTLTACNHIIAGNEISDFGKIVKCYEGGITFGGVGITVKNNLIYDGPHAGIIAGGNDCLIENNEIHSVLKEAADMGAIYSGRSMVKRGNIFKGNIIHNCTTTSEASHGITAIYFDDQLCGQDVTDNIIYKFDGGGVLINGGRDNTVTGNIFSELGENAAVSILASGRAKNWESEVDFENRLGLNSVPYQSEAYSKYPNLSNILEDNPMDPKYNVVKENKYYGVSEEISISMLHEYGSDMTMEEFLSINTIEEGTQLDTPYSK